MSYKVKLNIFEGPFDLLVYLIENAEMSIYDIRISEITEQYLAYIEEMKHQDVLVGTEFLVLAATLIDIKSRMLLPRRNPDGEMEEDPREELAARIAEYTKFKRLAAALEAQMDAASLKITKPTEDLQNYIGEPDVFLKMDMNEFILAFKAFLYKRKKNEELQAMRQDGAVPRVSIAAKKRSIRSLFAKAKKKILKFRAFLSKDGGRNDSVATFLSLLDLAKEGTVGVRQGGSYEEIEVELK
ncbi:MAG: segregation/condensation protein A [Clostridiales Family XIII bacterium]|jgi:segregation and condensation protein A|nr:segregation/condensation protein A [Clostridiales Family XIII bacterium]